MQHMDRAKNAKRDQIRLFYQVICEKSWTFLHETDACLFCSISLEIQLFAKRDQEFKPKYLFLMTFP